MRALAVATSTLQATATSSASRPPTSDEDDRLALRRLEDSERSTRRDVGRTSPAARSAGSGSAPLRARPAPKRDAVETCVAAAARTRPSSHASGVLPYPGALLRAARARPPRGPLDACWRRPGAPSRRRPITGTRASFSSSATALRLTRRRGFPLSLLHHDSDRCFMIGHRTPGQRQKCDPRRPLRNPARNRRLGRRARASYRGFFANGSAV